MDSKTAGDLFNNKVLFNNGKRGIVYLSECKKYLIKTRKPESSSPGTIKNEYFYNKKVNEFGVGPKIFYYNDENDFLIREFVDGEKISEFLEKSDKQNIVNVLLKIIDQTVKLDEHKINKYELTNPHKDIIIKNNEPYIIDFERCRYTDKPKNLTQFLQYLTRPRTFEWLKNKGINVEKEKIIKLGVNYKKNYEKKYVGEIKKIISS